MSGAPSEAAVRAANDLCYEFIVEHSDLAASYACSAREAAWRGDHRTLEMHLRQLRLTLIAVLQAFKEIAPESDNARAA